MEAVPGAPTLIKRKVATTYPGSTIARRRGGCTLRLLDSFNGMRVIPRRLVSTIITIDKDSPTCVFVFVRTVTSKTMTRKVPEPRTCRFTTRTMLKDTGVMLRAKGRPKRLGSVIYSPTKAAVRTIHMLRGFKLEDTIVRTRGIYTSVSEGVWRIVRACCDLTWVGG